MFCQDIDRVGPDMVLGIKLCDPEIHQEIGAMIKSPLMIRYAMSSSSWYLVGSYGYS